MKPNFECCQGCPYWDDINGCWAGMEQVCINDDGEPFVNMSEEEKDEISE